MQTQSELLLALEMTAYTSPSPCGVPTFISNEAKNTLALKNLSVSSITSSGPSSGTARGCTEVSSSSHGGRDAQGGKEAPRGQGRGCLLYHRRRRQLLVQKIANATEGDVRGRGAEPLENFAWIGRMATPPRTLWPLRSLKDEWYACWGQRRQPMASAVSRSAQ